MGLRAGTEGLGPATNPARDVERMERMGELLALRERDVGGLAGEGELVATDVHIGVEEVLRRAQALVARAQQREQSGVRNGHTRLDGLRMSQGVRRLLPLPPTGHTDASAITG